MIRRSETIALTVLLAAAWGDPVLGQTASFTATGNMTTPRYGHTATLLPNGKVLIAGGFGTYELGHPGLILGTAELYDPSTGTFTPTGSMTTARTRHTATLLPDGKVLIAGGSRGPGPVAISVEIYDPATDTFTATDQSTTWSTGRAILLNNGKIFLSGYGSWAELYDPANGILAPAGAYAAISGADPVAMLANGKVLLGSCDSRTELYDPQTGAFSLTGSLTASPRGYRCSYSSTLLADGKVLVAGGDNDFYYPTVAELYDAATGTFTQTGNMTVGREFHTATLLPDSTVLIAGGADYFPSTTAELYNPATGAFSATGNMTTPRLLHTATLLGDGTVLIAGGIAGLPRGNSSGIVNFSAEIYKPPTLQPAPVLFSVTGDGRGQGAILHAGTAQLASPSNPAVVGEALEVYCSGLMGGSVIPPQVAIGGRMAEVLFFGKAPGFAALNQVNVRVPSGIGSGPAVPVRVTYLGRPSNEVTIGVR